MRDRRSLEVRIAALACLLACIGDVVVPEVLTGNYPGYDPKVLSESMLGAAGSPVAHLFTAWSICLAVLFFVFARGLHQAFTTHVQPHVPASWLLAMYGIGEGLGSGLFPFNHDGQGLTMAGKVHVVMSMSGVAALYLLPLSWLLWPPEKGPRLKTLSTATLVSGGSLLVLFGLSKMEVIGFLGFWQRTFLVVYYLYLLVLCRAMLRTLPPRVNREREVAP
ncbi:MAG: DUF998 domain-containing protein [Bacteroidetes bacterium]|nr:DUF998 domain-containing protein [Bacteroidota bacterium]